MGISGYLILGQVCCTERVASDATNLRLCLSRLKPGPQRRSRTDGLYQGMNGGPLRGVEGPVYQNDETVGSLPQIPEENSGFLKVPSVPVGTLQIRNSEIGVPSVGSA